MGRKTLRENFEESYTAVSVPAKNKKGFRMKYVYYAPWYVWDMSREFLQHQKWILLITGVTGFLLNVAAMCQQSSVNQMPIAFVPCALILCCHIMEFVGLVKFLLAGYKTTKMTYDEVNKLLLFMPLVRGILGMFLVIVCAYFAVTGGEGFLLVGMALAYGLSAASGFVLRSSYERIPVTVLENDTLKKYDELSMGIQEPNGDIQ